MPRSVSDLYNDQTGRSVDDLYQDQQPDQPDTSEADKVREQGPIRRTLGSIADVVNPLPGLGKLGKAMWENPLPHKLDPLANAAGGFMGLEYGREAVDHANHGRWGDALRSALQANPLGAYIRRGYEKVGEQYGMGNTAGAIGTGIGEGINAAAGGGAFAEGGVAREGLDVGLGNTELHIPGTADVANVGKNYARRVYQGALLPNKWFRDLPGAQLKETLDKGLREGIMPSESGFQKASGRVADLSDQIDDIAMKHADERLPMDRVDMAGSLEIPGYEKNLFSSEKRQMADVNKNLRGIKFTDADPQEIIDAKQQMADAINVKAKLTNPPGQPFPPDVTVDDISDAALRATKYPSTMTVKDLMELKRTVRDSLTTPQGRLLASDIVDSFANHIAGAANQTITSAFPELKALGLEDRDWINLRTIIKEAAGKTANRSISGLAGAMTPMAIAVKGAEGAATAGKAAIIGAVMRNPVVRSRLASLVFRASNGATGLTQTMARFGAIDAELNRMEDADQRNAASTNAR